MRKRIVSLVLAMAMCFSLSVTAFAMEPAEIIHAITLEGEIFQIAEFETVEGLKFFRLANIVSPSKMHLAEVALNMVADPNYDAYATDTVATTNTFYVTTAGVEYYKRVIDEPSNLHATTMATYESYNASYSNSGHDMISTDCSTAWYGSIIPTTISVEHTVTFYVEDTETPLTVSNTGASMTFTTSNDKIIGTCELELEDTQLARINDASVIIYNDDLKGGYITHCVSSTHGTARVGNTLYQAQADVRFENSVN